MNPSYKIIIKDKIFSILILNDNMYEFMYKKDMKICSIFNTQKKEIATTTSIWLRNEMK